MAKNIALVTLDKTHAAAVNTKNLLTGLGHTVTLFNDAEVTASNLSAFDLIITARCANTNTALHGTLLAYHKPWIMGVDQGLIGASYTSSAPISIKLASEVYANAINKDITITDASHPITANATNSIFNNNDYICGIKATLPKAGSKLAYFYANTDYWSIVAYEKGILDLNNNPTNARMVFLGFLNGGSGGGYTANAGTITNNAINWVTTSPVAIRRHAVFI